MFGRATIRLGIGPHSSSDIFSSDVLVIQSKANFMAVSSAGNIVTLLVNRMLFIMSILGTQNAAAVFPHKIGRRN